MEKEIWNMEKKLWSHAESGELENYFKMLHEKFSDWPSTMESPFYGVDDMKKYVNKKMENLLSMRFNIDHKMTQIIDNDEAIVYFNIEMIGKHKNGGEIISNSRMMHIWKRSNGELKLLGGFQSEMSN